MFIGETTSTCFETSLRFLMFFIRINNIIRRFSILQLGIQASQSSEQKSGSHRQASDVVVGPLCGVVGLGLGWA